MKVSSIAESCKSFISSYGIPVPTHVFLDPGCFRSTRIRFLLMEAHKIEHHTGVESLGCQPSWCSGCSTILDVRDYYYDL